MKEIQDPSDIYTIILRKALDFRAYCLQLDAKELECFFDMGTILGMKLQIRLKYKRELK